jgi:hypothetical protein
MSKYFGRKLNVPSKAQEAHHAPQPYRPLGPSDLICPPARATARGRWLKASPRHEGSLHTISANRDTSYS